VEAEAEVDMTLVMGPMMIGATEAVMKQDLMMEVEMLSHSLVQQTRGVPVMINTVAEVAMLGNNRTGLQLEEDIGTDHSLVAVE
jgi:hypothetical protein